MNIFKKIISFLIITIINTTLIVNFQSNVYATAILNANYRKIANVAVLLYSFNDPFMLELKQNLEYIENENKDKIRFTFYDGKNNITVQNETIDSLLNSNTDLFMLNLADIRENIVEDIIHKAKPKNIPLVFLDIHPNVVSKVSGNYDKAAFILANSDLAGTVQGNIIVNLWNTNKNALDKNGDKILQYVLLQGEVDNPVAIDRTKYVLSTINDSGIKTQELALINANWFKEFAKESINNLFLKYDGRIEAIIANNDAMAIGAIEALQKYGYNKDDKSKNIAVVGIDAIPEAKDLVDKGIMTGTVVQDPKVLAEVFYNVGTNLVNNLSPIENTPYKIINGEIIIPFPYQEYIKK
jgi:ABC-type sugar transport system, periplasmic component